ncbi:EamA family transporter [Patescibacteria group bacterium]|nr:EamA family transporter [Patescibacteria group bacterium]MBU4347059.1 EamA family transporter [Patescibacteria group bacterium]MBU4455483.1 EamA family transporter [Patescibacteria group bacterium]MCG2690491.1 EamA family transporter [Candidatus Parcubacteria bacterium]
MTSGILFAIIAAIAFGVWTVFHQQAANKIDYLVGAIIISFTAVVLGLMFLLPKIKSTALFSNPKGILFAVLAGVCALAIDFFALKAYGSGLAVSVAGPIIIGGSIAVAAVIGLFMGETLTLMKVLGLIFVIAGASILAAFSK